MRDCGAQEAVLEKQSSAVQKPLRAAPTTTRPLGALPTAAAAGVFPPRAPVRSSALFPASLVPALLLPSRGSKHHPFSSLEESS